jgi:hypothetical protein
MSINNYRKRNNFTFKVLLTFKLNYLHDLKFMLQCLLSFSVITDDLTLSSNDQNVFCIVNYKEDYDHLKLAWKPIFQKINTLCEITSIFVPGATTFYEGNNMVSALLWFL